MHASVRQKNAGSSTVCNSQKQKKHHQQQPKNPNREREETIQMSSKNRINCGMFVQWNYI